MSRKASCPHCRTIHEVADGSLKMKCKKCGKTFGGTNVSNADKKPESPEHNPAKTPSFAVVMFLRSRNRTSSLADRVPHYRFGGFSPTSAKYFSLPVLAKPASLPDVSNCLPFSSVGVQTSERKQYSL